MIRTESSLEEVFFRRKFVQVRQCVKWRVCVLFYSGERHVFDRGDNFIARFVVGLVGAAAVGLVVGIVQLGRWLCGL